ncbi:MAG: YqgE/AlgH family protein [Bacteroidetes bacterium]|nr:YqgE/AlgH family protein [Bacteroidota bacterium]
MDVVNFERPENATLLSGRLLIAEPFLNDPNFYRSVILLCEHGNEGSVGFVLNHATNLQLGDLFPALSLADFTIYQGGPVQPDTLHMLHKESTLFGGTRISENIFWGGSYQALQEALLAQQCNSSDVRLLVGYSGWKKGQLDTEVIQGHWMVYAPTEAELQELLFHTDALNIWKRCIQLLGSSYNYMLNLPPNPQLN